MITIQGSHGSWKVLKNKQQNSGPEVLNLGIGHEKVLISVTVVLKNQLGQLWYCSYEAICVSKLTIIYYYITPLCPCVWL